MTPVSLRPYLTTYVNLCWVIGQLLAAGLLKGLLTMEGQWAYRIPFGLQWVWPVPIFIICFFAPESPWWLVRHNKIDEARAALVKLTSKKNTAFNVEETLAMMIHTNELEIQQSAGTQYQDCFKGTDLRRTEVTVMVWMIQQTSGSAMIGWGTYFMTQVGLSGSDAYSLGVGQYAMAFTGTVASWFLMPHCGRRTLYLWGQGVMFAGLIAIGCLGIPKLSTSTGWAIGALMLIETFVYDITVGPVCVSPPFHTPGANGLPALLRAGAGAMISHNPPLSPHTPSTSPDSPRHYLCTQRLINRYSTRSWLKCPLRACASKLSSSHALCITWQVS